MMSEWKTLDPMELEQSPFRLVGKDWMLVTAEKDGAANTMTASWGGMGVLWRKNVVFVFVRHSRYTYEFMEAAQTFSLAFFDEKYRKMLSYCGKVSGRDENKIAESGLTLAHGKGAPYFEEAHLAILCKKLYFQDLQPQNFIDKDIIPDCYGSNDWHRVYVGEILQILGK